MAGWPLSHGDRITGLLARMRLNWGLLNEASRLLYLFISLALLMIYCWIEGRMESWLLTVRVERKQRR